MNQNPALEILEFTPPESLDQPGIEEFLDYVDLRNEVYKFLDGDNADIVTPADALGRFQTATDYETIVFVAKVSGKIVARGMLELSKEPGSKLAEINLDVRPAFWGQGIGTLLLEKLEALAAEKGRITLQIWSGHKEEPELEQLPASTGVGTVPLDHVAKFLNRNGYKLNQVELQSSYQLNEAKEVLLQQLDLAKQKAGQEYEYLNWQAPIPEEFVAAFAELKVRMSVEMPHGDLEFEQENWDETRVRNYDQKILKTGAFRLTGAIRHKASGELVAYNELFIGEDRTQLTHQMDTYVLSSHRGHSLGLLVKAANLLSWLELVPESSHVVTYNAAENKNMLAINYQLGFVTDAKSGAWEKQI